MRHIKESLPDPEKLRKSERSYEAVKNLEKAFEESRGLTPKEIEDEILSVEGAEKGRGLDQLRERSKGKKDKK